MREAKSYRDPYSIKRTSAMSGPHRRVKHYRWQRAVLTVLAFSSAWAAVYYIVKHLCR